MTTAKGKVRKAREFWAGDTNPKRQWGTSLTLRVGVAELRTLILVPEFEADADALGPEIVVVEGEDGPVRALKAGVAQARYQAGVHAGIDLPARTSHVGPVEERITDRQPDVLRELITKLDAEFRYKAEAVSAVQADVALLHEQALAGKGGSGAALLDNDRRAADIHGLVHGARREFAQHIQTPTPPAKLAFETKLGPIEAVLRAETISQRREFEAARREWHFRLTDIKAFF